MHTQLGESNSKFARANAQLCFRRRNKKGEGGGEEEVVYRTADVNTFPNNTALLRRHVGAEKWHSDLSALTEQFQF